LLLILAIPVAVVVGVIIVVKGRKKPEAPAPPILPPEK
jgi:hypothetical protein